MNLSLSFGLIFRTMVLKSNSLLELPKELCKIWLLRGRIPDEWDQYFGGFLNLHRLFQQGDVVENHCLDYICSSLD